MSQNLGRLPNTGVVVCAVKINGCHVITFTDVNDDSSFEVRFPGSGNVYKISLPDYDGGVPFLGIGVHGVDYQSEFYVTYWVDDEQYDYTHFNWN
jgi:hypothetical protein